MRQLPGFISASLWFWVHLQTSANVSRHWCKQRSEWAVQKAPNEFRTTGLWVLSAHRQTFWGSPWDESSDRTEWGWWRVSEFQRGRGFLTHRMVAWQLLSGPDVTVLTWALLMCAVVLSSLLLNLSLNTFLIIFFSHVFDESWRILFFPNQNFCHH